MVSSSSVVLVGQSSIKQGKNDHCFAKKTFLKKHKRIAEKETQWNVSTSVEKPMPLIKKQGYLKGPRCERILVKLEILQDNGHFDEQAHLVTSFLQR